MTALALLFPVFVFVGWAMASWVFRHAERLRLVQPPNHRSSHQRPTPNGGGLGIVLAGSLAGFWLAVENNWSAGLAITTCGLLLAAMGLRDDIRHLPILFRITAQIAIAACVIFALGDLPDIELPSHVSLSGALLSLLLLLLGVWWINLFNFMDGIDGIAGSQALFMLLVAAGLGVWERPLAEAWITVNPAWLWMLCLAAATLGFLILNWPPAKIFMGDVGSTYLGIMIFALALVSVQEGWLSFPVWLVLGALFAVDATMTLLSRMVRGERWYESHRSHVYQRLSVRWSGHRPVTLLAIAVNVFWLAPLAWVCHVHPRWAMEAVALAYVPLILGAVVLGAGKSVQSAPPASGKASI